MGYQKPVLFAGLGMIAGAASVALLALMIPGTSETSSYSAASLSAHTHQDARYTADAPVITGPRSASRQAAHPLNSSIQKVSTGLQESAPTMGLQEQTLTVKRGDTLLGMLVNAGVEPQDAHNSVDAVRDVYDPRALRPGDEVTLTFLVSPESQEFNGFSLDPDPIRTVLSAKDTDGGFSASELKATVHSQTHRYQGTIQSSLFLAASEQGMPVGPLTQLIKIFSYDVDFQRDIHPGDAFAVMFSQKATSSGDVVGDTEIQYASMTLSGQKISLYRYEDSDGFVDYYNSKGQSIRKALLRTPINGARLSSGFGVRRHPILGFTKMHKGVDFAAPRGTPIFAAGDGVIVKEYRSTSYGNYIRIRHTPTFSTAYAHMRNFAKGVHKGSRVRQGDIIGYVGTTGRSTGPHLHYEILKNGTQVNPLKVRFPSGHQLAGKELKRFKAAQTDIAKTYAALPVSNAVTMVSENTVPDGSEATQAEDE